MRLREAVQKQERRTVATDTGENRRAIGLEGMIARVLKEVTHPTRLRRPPPMVNRAKVFARLHQDVRPRRRTAARSALKYVSSSW